MSRSRFRLACEAMVVLAALIGALSSAAPVSALSAHAALDKGYYRAGETGRLTISVLNDGSAGIFVYAAEMNVSIYERSWWNISRVQNVSEPLLGMPAYHLPAGQSVSASIPFELPKNMSTNLYDYAWTVFVFSDQKPYTYTETSGSGTMQVYARGSLAPQDLVPFALVAVFVVVAATAIIRRRRSKAGKPSAGASPAPEFGEKRDQAAAEKQ